MPLPVKLSEVTFAMDMSSDESASYINRRTGEIIVICDDVMSDDDEDGLPEWQAESLADARKVAASDDFVQLPDKYDIHDYGIMKNFCHTVEDDAVREDLLDAINGRGAFRLFKRMVARRGLEQDWYAYRDAAYDQIAIDFLEAQGIAFERP